MFRVAEESETRRNGSKTFVYRQLRTSSQFDLETGIANPMPNFRLQVIQVNFDNFNQAAANFAPDRDGFLKHPSVQTLRFTHHILH